MERREGDQIKCLRDGEKRGRSDKVFEGWREEREIGEEREIR